MFYCWCCDAPVKVTEFDWFCTNCGQNGELVKITRDREEGYYRNIPYQKERETFDELSTPS